MWHNFPYTNFHDLNLDWLLDKVKDLAVEFVKLKGNFDDLESGMDEFKTFILNDISEFKNYVENYIETVNFEQIVLDKLNEMEESGELDRIIQEAVQNYITMPSILNVNRLGTIYKNYNNVTYPLLQGTTVVDSTHAYAYYASWDSYDNGELVHFNPINNTTYGSITLNARHGQSLTHDNDNVYILNYYKSDEDLATSQYISIVNREDMSINTKKQIVFDGVLYGIWGLAYDKESGKLYAGASQQSSDFTNAALLELVEQDDRFNAVFVSNLYKADTNQPCVDICVDNRYIYALTSSRSILVWFKSSFQLKTVVNLPKTCQDYFKLEEMEALSILDNGDTYLSVVSVITQETSAGNRSGVYLNTFAKSNIYTNVAKKYTSFDNLIAREELIRVFVNSTTSDGYACVGGGSDSANSLDTIYKALMYDFDNRLYRIYIRPNHVEEIDTLNITNRQNIVISNDSENLTVDDIIVADSNNIRLYRIDSNTTNISASNDIIISEAETGTININNSFIKVYNSTFTTINCNSASEIETNTPLNYSSFSNIVPTTTSYDYRNTTPTVDSNGVATGFMVNKLTNRRIVILAIAFTYNSVTQYVRQPITIMSPDWYQDLSTRGGTFKTRLKVIDNQLYITEIDGIDLSTVTNILIASAL